MADLESTIIKLDADVTGLKAAMFDGQRALENATKRMEGQVANFAKQTDSNLGFFRLSWAAAIGSFAGDVFMRAMSGATSAVTGFVQAGIAGAAEDEAAFQRLNQALAKTGYVTAATQREMAEFAEKMMLASTAGDDQVASTMALIQTMSGLEKEGLKKATQASLDLAAAMNIDLETAASAVAKAANGNTTALNKMGFEFKKGATDSITFANALATIEARAGGSASAATKTYAGAMLQLKVAYGEASEALAKAITQNPVMVNIIRTVTEEIRNLTGWIDRNKTTIQAWVNTGVIIAVDAVALLAFGAHHAAKAFRAMQAAMSNDKEAEALLARQREIDAEYKAFDESLIRIRRSAMAANQATGEVYGPPAQAGAASIKDHYKGINQELETMKSAAAQAGASLAKSLNSEDARYQRKLSSVDTEFDADQDSPDEYTKRLEEVRLIEQEHYAAQMVQLAQARQENLLTEQAYTEAKAGLTEQFALKSEELEKKKDKADAERNKRRAENLKSTLAYISTLQQSSSKELFMIGKAAAIATATIEGYKAVNVALGSAPPPFNFALAALVGAAAAVNIGKIASQQPPAYAHGIDSVPGSGNQDSVHALLTPRERVVPVKTNQDLTNFLSRQNQGEGGGGGGTVVHVNITIQGNVLDRRESGLHIAEALTEAFRHNGIQLPRGIVA